MPIMYNKFYKILIRVFHMFVAFSLKLETKGGSQVERKRGHVVPFFISSLCEQGIL